MSQRQINHLPLCISACHVATINVRRVKKRDQTRHARGTSNKPRVELASAKMEVSGSKLSIESNSSSVGLPTVANMVIWHNGMVLPCYNCQIISLPPIIATTNITLVSHYLVVTWEFIVVLKDVQKVYNRSRPFSCSRFSWQV